MSVARLSPASVTDSAERAAHLAEMLRAVAHPIRLRIIAILCEGEEHVNALAGRMDVPQAIVSQQLSILRAHRLVSAQRVEGKAVYRLEEPRLRNLVKCVEGCRL